ncbi:MAG TPA: hypothetical protein VGI74_19770 [Streptosporangiaceae bacterium]|jgi:hypothetical protein
MACCNRRRAQLTPRSPGAVARPAGTARSPAAPDVTAPGAPEVALRFTGARWVRVEGVVSGQIYRASPTAPLLSARQEDVRSLLRSGFFVRA